MISPSHYYCSETIDPNQLVQLVVCKVNTFQYVPTREILSNCKTFSAPFIYLSICELFIYFFQTEVFLLSIFSKFFSIVNQIKSFIVMSFLKECSKLLSIDFILFFFDVNLKKCIKSNN